MVSRNAVAKIKLGNILGKNLSANTGILDLPDAESRMVRDQCQIIRQRKISFLLFGIGQKKIGEVVKDL
jgi:hypothetical protein